MRSLHLLGWLQLGDNVIECTIRYQAIVVCFHNLNLSCNNVESNVASITIKKALWPLLVCRRSALAGPPLPPCIRFDPSCSDHGDDNGPCKSMSIVTLTAQDFID